MATKNLKKAQYGTATGKSRGMYDPNTGMNRPTTPMGQAKRGAVVKKKMAKGGLAKAQPGASVPVGTVVKDGRVWNGKGYNPAPVNPTPTNTVPVGTVINDGRIWNGKGYDPAPVKGKHGGTKMQTGGPKMVSWMKDGLSKSTGKRRIIDSKVPMTGPDAPMGKTPMARKGGATKAKRFAALAPPYNKATAADRIAGAKKKKK